MRSSHNLIKLAIIFIFMAVIYIDYNYVSNQQTTEVQLEESVIAKQVDNKQIQCMADNIYYEAGGESTEGKAAVARVVLNRITHGFANTPCKVVYQATHVKQVNEETEQAFWVKVCQFSWVCEGKGNPNRNTSRYQTSLQVAKDVLIYDKYKEVIPKTVLFFHNTSIVNHYPHEVVKRIGNHIFYKKKHVKHRKTNQYVKKSPETHLLNGKVSGGTETES